MSIGFGEECEILIISFNHAAGYLFTGISGRLGGKVVRHAVDDDGPADDLRYGYAGIEKGGPDIAVV